MPSTRELRLRIRAVTNIQKITRAMQMIAASRLKRAQDAALAMGPYSDKLAYMIRELSPERNAVRHPLLAERPVQKRLIVVISSDKGLCGAYNTNVLRKLRSVMSSGPSADVLSVGKKALNYLRFRKIPPVQHFPMPSAGADLTLVNDVVQYLVDAYTAETYDEVTLVYTQFHSAVTMIPTAAQLLPLQTPEDSGSADAEAHRAQFIFEPSVEELLPLLMHRYVQNQIYRGLVDGFASELGARMVAMKSATDNADELIGDLRLTYNRLRQANITKELLEVISGAEALA